MPGISSGDQTMVHPELKKLISELFYAAQEIPKLQQLILFGSIAREEEDGRSDVDLLLVFNIKGDPERKIRDITHRRITEAFKKSECQRNAQITFANTDLDLDPDFLEKMVRGGIIIWGRPMVFAGGDILTPMILFEYTVGMKSGTDKVMFYRALKRIQFIKIKNGIVVDEKGAEDVDRILQANRISYHRKQIWFP
jgi:predicted nucleotidyltransferase